MTDLITTIDQAITTLDNLRAQHDDVGVFWDRGWGDNDETADISIIVDGDGQQPHARINATVYALLVDRQIIDADSYIGFKARRIHAYKPTPPPEKTGPTAYEVAEEILTGMFAAHQDLPMKTAFTRGFTKNPYSPIVKDTYTTDAYGTGGFVNLSPGGAEVYLSAWDGPGFFRDRIGDGVTVQFPRADDGKPDLDAMRSPEFTAELLAAVHAQLALLPA